MEPGDICLPFLFCNLTFYIIGTSAECSLEKAELRAAEYGKRFDSEAAYFRKTSLGSDSLMQLCIEKLNGSETSDDFWNSTNYCLPEEVDYVIQQWNETENDVNAICKDACPRYVSFPPSAYIVDMAALTDGRYTDFCRSMNLSMAYATGNATNCKFGMAMYYSFLSDGAKKVWEDICRLGCSNLDNSISSIQSCYRVSTDQTSMCDNVFTNEGMSAWRVLLKYYKDFDKNEKMCMTTTSTTSTTTTLTTTTTTVSTTTTARKTTAATAIIKDTTTLHVSSTATEREMETSQAPVSFTTTPAKMLNISACITEADHQLFSQKFPNLTKELIMKVLKIESCLYRLNNDPNIVTKAVANLPTSFQNMFTWVQKDGYDVLIQLPECAKPRPNDVNCDGHNYGILACSGEAPGCTKILLFVSILILVEHIFQ
ncbi:hypothetical protein ACJMK2_012716 [Sinanodonta woodiana]|uniref:Uncharacterized protein n=1 Tax=Sinanodonta woodiana TaxID=1069815 RepID=A0ABD3V9E3_SINWO